MPAAARLKSMRTFLAATVLIAGLVTAQAQAEMVPRALVPFLKDLRQTAQQPQLVVEPGTLPPSPITGRNSTLVAIRIGTRSVELDPKVVEVIDRLAAWDVREPLGAADQQIVGEWVDELRVALLARLAARGTGVGCDDECVVRHLTKPSTLLGETREEQVEMRNELLLNALIEAVKD